MTALGEASTGLECRWLSMADRRDALAHLGRDPVGNLFLLDLVDRLGSSPAPGETRTEMAGVWCGSELVGVAAVRPSIVFDTGVVPEAVEPFLPFLEALGVGLVKSATPVVDVVWRHLSRRRRRRALVDRTETAYLVRSGKWRLRESPAGATSRVANRDDLAPLVHAARESLREESRPDPFAGDARGFQRWVRGRVPRARVVECDDEIVYVGYADVRRREGWLLQGVYTWPAVRRRGFASFGVSEICREAFHAGADHLQLAVVDGNEPGRRLYEGLGFEPFGSLRTILFV